MFWCYLIFFLITQEIARLNRTFCLMFLDSKVLQKMKVKIFWWRLIFLLITWEISRLSGKFCLMFLDFTVLTRLQFMAIHLNASKAWYWEGTMCDHHWDITMCTLLGHQLYHEAFLLETKRVHLYMPLQCHCYCAKFNTSFWLTSQIPKGSTRWWHSNNLYGTVHVLATTLS